MPHCFHHMRDAAHAYGPGGIGARDGITVESITEGSEIITDTIDLPGFVLGNVTYESHHFWVHFASYARVAAVDRYAGRDSSVYIRIHHGSGWELWRGDYMLGMALRRFGPDAQGMFLLLWYLWDTAREAREVGRDQTAREYQTAFVQGRLKKRKLPAKGVTKVWIEPAREADATFVAR